jgi:hypothetical protein
MAKSTKKEEPELEVHAKLKGVDEKEWKKVFTKTDKKDKSGSSEGGGSMLYFVGFVGSLIYWWQAADGFGAVVTGFLKALVWPGYIAYKLLESFYGVAS